MATTLHRTMRHRARALATTAADYLRTWTFLTADAPPPTVGNLTGAPQSPPLTPTTSQHIQAPRGPPPADSAVLPTLEMVIQPDLHSFWANFDPDLEEMVPPPAPEEVHALFEELRLRTAPWGSDDWEAPTPPRSETASSEISHFSPTDTASTPSLPTEPEEDDAPSGAPLGLRIQPGTIHLLEPTSHRPDPNQEYADPSVEVCAPLFLHDTDRKFLRHVTTHGVNLPRPFGAPPTFIATRPSALMDQVIAAWKRAGLLVPNQQLRYAMPNFLIAKADGGVRPIVDFSCWTPYIVTPHFSLLAAGEALRRIPAGNFMIKIDLRSGFHQLPINTAHYNFNGIYYRGQKLSLTRLPMGHALAPAVFQRFSEGILRQVQRATGVHGTAYLDDWLLWGPEEEDLHRAVTEVEGLGVTINYEKSTLVPCKTLTYLGFRVDAE